MIRLAIKAAVFVLLVVLPAGVFGQTSQGPFADLIGKKIKSDNIFMVWQEEQTPGVFTTYQKMYRFLPGKHPDSTLQERNYLSNTPNTGGSFQMVAESGYFNDDLYADVVTAWEGAGGAIEIYIPKMDSSASQWGNKENPDSLYSLSGNSYSFGSITSEVSYLQGRILLGTGDLNGDGLDNFALSYKGDDQKLHLAVFSMDDQLNPVLLDSVVVGAVENLSFTHNPGAMTLADLNGDGKDEIVMAGVQDGIWIDGRWAVYFKAYEVTAGNQLQISGEGFSFPDPASKVPNYTQLRYTLETGNLVPGGNEELMFAWSLNSGSSSADDTFLYTINFDTVNDTVTISDRYSFNVVESASTMDPLSIKTGNLDGDQENLDEVVFAAEGKHYVFSVNPDTTFLFRDEFNQVHNRFGISYDYTEITDVNQDNVDEIVVGVIATTATTERFRVNVFSAYDRDNTMWRSEVAFLGSLENDMEIPLDQSGYRRYALATGSFDGYEFSLGEPQYFLETGNVQPLIVLNAPPIHFDILNGVEYDVNDCFSDTGCDFKATYTKTSSTATEITTEVRKDFGISAGVGISGSLSAAPVGLGVTSNFEAYFDVNYGSNFSQTDTQGEVVSVSVEIGAVEDDLIYATVSDYHYYEYPVFHGAETTPQRNILVVEPRETKSQWFPSKSWNAATHTPGHEVGNILSYPSYAQVVENPAASQAISGYSDTFTLDANSSFSWILDKQTFEQNSADSTRQIGYDAKYHVGNIRLSSDYTRSDLSTHTTTVRQGLNVTVDLGNIDRSIGENRYSVTPYTYWGTNGAMVVDYAVTPERSGGGGSPTWWEEKYGNLPDPAFILPLRYDPEKGLGIGDESKRNQTQDIFFNYEDPELADTLTITARIRNFSLKDAAPVTAHFYLGDPDNGGQAIVGVNGESSVITETAIPAQRFSDVSLLWEVPGTLPSNPRIYVVLNESSAMEEIHLSNNKGFNILTGTGVAVSNEEQEQAGLPEKVILYPSYPNPFNPTTTIAYELPETAKVRLDVFNVVGKQVATLENGVRNAGYHEVRFNATGLSSGLYFYRITTNSFVSVKKMMLIK